MFLVVPQWQGSGSSRSMRLVDGAHAIHGDLPVSKTRSIEVPLEAGDERGTGVARCGSLLLVRERMHQELSQASEPVLTVGGDCGVELAAVEHVLAGASGPDVAVVWFDAHPDLNTPESSPGGAFHGMVLRTLLGEGHPDLVPAVPLAADRLILAGVRAFDDAEAEYLATTNVRHIGVDELTAASLITAIEATGATAVYLHIDVDVLDPSEFTGLGYPEPFGLATAALVDLIKAVKARFTVVGSGLTEFAPASVDGASEDLPTVLRLIGALNA